MRKRSALSVTCTALSLGFLAFAHNAQPAMLPATGDNDMRCATGYALAAFAVQSFDADISAYYSRRAAAAGRRYLQTHPGETQQSYVDKLASHARALQAQVMTSTVTPEAFVAGVSRCELNSKTRIVL